ncbi:MAG: hypothetical protein U9R75_01085, partial [Candidatus Thermoplasmatota archaeon]|nr:hypothetical protein [Candidatus Thermoplasmatota archaeon]
MSSAIIWDMIGTALHDLLVVAPLKLSALSSDLLISTISLHDLLVVAPLKTGKCRSCYKCEYNARSEGHVYVLSVSTIHSNQLLWGIKMSNMKKRSLASLMVILLLASAFALIVPIGSAKEIKKETGSNVFEPMNEIFSGPYNGDTYHVGVGPHNFTTIQDGVDATSDGDKVIVHSRPASYIEEVVVTTRIHIMGEAGTLLTSPAVPSPIGFTLNTNGVTISGMNITEFYKGVYSTFSGHNFTRNIFWLNRYDVDINIKRIDHSLDITIEGLVFLGNQVVNTDVYGSFDIDIYLDYDEITESTVIVEDMVFINNDMRSSHTSNRQIDYDLTIKQLDDGIVKVGEMRFLKNHFEGGGYDVRLDTDISYISDADVTTGDIVFLGNDLLRYDDYGIYTDISTEYWDGFASGRIGEMVIR